MAWKTKETDVTRYQDDDIGTCRTCAHFDTTDPPACADGTCRFREPTSRDGTDSCLDWLEAPTDGD